MQSQRHGLLIFQNIVVHSIKKFEVQIPTSSINWTHDLYTICHLKPTQASNKYKNYLQESWPKKKILKPDSKDLVRNFLNFVANWSHDLPQANELPPDSSNSKPDDNIDHRDDEPIAPPFSQRDIASPIKHRGWPNSIVGQTTHEVGEECKHHGSE